MKIYGVTRTSSLSEESMRNLLNSWGYTKNTVTDLSNYPSVSTLTSNNYNTVIIYSSYGGVDATYANAYSNAGINLITIGNDSTNLRIINSSSYSSSSTTGTYTKISNNIMSQKIGNIGFRTSDSRYSIKFITGTEVIYSETVDSSAYDALGYYTSNGTKWFHSQMSTTAIIKPALDYIANKGLYYYKVTSKGTYSFIVTDNAGNSNTVSYTYK